MPQSIPNWGGNRALLFVHGIGDAMPGHYQHLVDRFRVILGAAVNEFAIYTLYYDEQNDWFARKTQAAEKLERLVNSIRSKAGEGDFAESAADFAGDVVWPVLSINARMCVRTAFMAQLQQIVIDGIESGVPASRQHLSIICHSLGCFHTYETLHFAARSVADGLTPGTDAVRFDNVILMASPVMLIRTVAGGLGDIIPNKQSLACVADAKLTIPSETLVGGEIVTSVRRWISITGTLDPVGGHFARRKCAWAYMDVEGQISIIDDQELLDVGDSQLSEVFRNAIAGNLPPKIAVVNPHDWSGYIDRHEESLRAWLL